MTPAMLQCPGAKAATCLAPEQVSALRRGSGATHSLGSSELYFNWAWDAGIGDPGWRSWKLGTSTTCHVRTRGFAH
jgi:feruloyl esterase